MNVALIPARAGSSRCPGKNIRPLCGHPLLAYSIASALESGLFDGGIWVSSEDEATLRLAEHYGALTIRRPAALATGDAPDIDWVRHAVETLGSAPETVLWILRPTSPFRTARVLLRAAHQWDQGGMDTLRAVQRVTEHPGKMWTMDAMTGLLVPVWTGTLASGVPYHSSPTQRLPPVYVQNACLDVTYVDTVRTLHRITGTRIAPFFTYGSEGLDINTDADWARAEAVARDHPERLPTVRPPSLS